MITATDLILNTRGKYWGRAISVYSIEYIFFYGFYI